MHYELMSEACWYCWCSVVVVAAAVVVAGGVVVVVVAAVVGVAAG